MGIYYGCNMVYITIGTYRLVHQSKPPTRSSLYVIIDNAIISYFFKMGKGVLYQSTHFQFDISICSQYFAFLKAPHNILNFETF